MERQQTVIISKMDLSHRFSRPLLIYDDQCLSCTKFARAANILSRGRIHTAGHYYSIESIEIKKIIFPEDYDPTSMFWLVNKKGAYGARTGLAQVAKEIAIGLFKGEGSKDAGNNDNNNNNTTINNHPIACGYKDQRMSCGSSENTLKRILHMMRNSGRFSFQN